MTFASFLSWSKSISNPETGITMITQLPPSFQRWTTPLNSREQAGWHLISPRRAPRSQHGWLEILSPFEYFHFDWGLQVVGCNPISSARKVSHLSTVSIGASTLKFPWDPSSGLGFKPPCIKSISWVIRTRLFLASGVHTKGLRKPSRGGSMGDQVALVTASRKSPPLNSWQ